MTIIDLATWLLEPMRGSADRCFWDFVDEDGSPQGCWLWTGPTNRAGYGLWRRRLAHRLTLQLTQGKLPVGRYALHRCDNPPCVNPAHLYEGGASENLIDARDRGLWIHPNAKKTHCKNSHPFAGANLILIKKGNGEVARRCRKCDNARKAASARRTYARRRGVA